MKIEIKSVLIQTRWNRSTLQCLPIKLWGIFFLSFFSLVILVSYLRRLWLNNGHKSYFYKIYSFCLYLGLQSISIFVYVVRPLLFILSSVCFVFQISYWSSDLLILLPVQINSWAFLVNFSLWSLYFSTKKFSFCFFATSILLIFSTWYDTVRNT